MNTPRRIWLFRAVFAVSACLITSVSLELATPALYRLVLHQPFSKARSLEKLMPGQNSPQAGDITVVSSQRPEVFRNHILHPYLGFVASPGIYTADWEFSRQGRTQTVNEFGFPGPSPLQKKKKGAVTLCILGGSFAMNLYLDSRETLVEELKKRGFHGTEEITVVSLAMSGWKQPQQLLALNYFISLGASYDAVINLDGFNELVLPFIENVPADIFPFFPRAWPLYTSQLGSDWFTPEMAEVIRLREKEEQLRRRFSGWWSRRSNFCLLWFEVLDSRVRNEITVADQSLEEALRRKQATRSAERFGPAAPKYTAAEEFYDAMGAYWESCSRQMNELCRARDMTYLHFLQPNQYVRDSKPMSEDERAVAYTWSTSRYPGKTCVENGYPYLLAHGNALRRDGVNFTDLSMVFKTIEEPLYEDSCCHVNKRGNDLIAVRIAEILAAGK